MSRAQLTPAQKRLYDHMKATGATVDFGGFIGRLTTTIPGYQGRISDAMMKALKKAGCAHVVLVKPGEALPGGGVNKLRVPRHVWVAD